MVRFSAPSPLALVVTTAVTVLSAGCFDTSSNITTADYPTRLTVDPVMFRGPLKCGAPGLEHYVVALYNVTSGQDPNLRVTSSGPIACQNVVSFGEPILKSNNFYKATIDGYDRLVRPDPDSESEGAVRPKMVDVSSGEEVLPAWTTTCGEVPPPRPAADAEVDVLEDGPPAYNQLRYPTLVLGKTEVILHGCRPLAALPERDASTDDGSSGDSDGSVDASTEASDGAEPDGGPDADPDDGASEGGPDEDGGVDEGGRALSPLSHLGVANRSLHA
jgi:hypothetical protein